jgi:hypothetical protein
MTLLFAAGLTLPAAAQDLENPLPPAERFRGDPVQFEHCTWVPAAARTLRLHDRMWSTGVDVVNTATEPTRISIALLERGEDNLTAHLAMLEEPVEAGATVHLDDVVDYVLERRWRSWHGGLVVCASEHEVEVSSHTALVDLEAETTFGQGIPGLGLDEAVHPGQVGHLIGLREDEQFRSNLGLLNPNPGPIDVRLRLVADDGSTALVIIHDLHAYSQIQYHQILAMFPIDRERARVEVTSADGPVFAYASLLDNATNDPSYIPCRVRAGD